MNESELLNIVYNYYPKDVFHPSDESLNSIEFKRLELKCRQPHHKKNTKLIYKKLCKTFGESNVIDFTHLQDNQPSYRYSIRLEAEKNNYIFIMINVSILINQYSIYRSNGVKTLGKWKYDITYDNFTENEDFLKIKILQFLNSELPNYSEFPVDLNNKIVPRICTHKKLVGEATFFDCLFSDHLW